MSPNVSSSHSDVPRVAAAGGCVQLHADQHLDVETFPFPLPLTPLLSPSLLIWLLCPFFFVSLPIFHTWIRSFCPWICVFILVNCTLSTWLCAISIRERMARWSKPSTMSLVICGGEESLDSLPVWTRRADRSCCCHCVYWRWAAISVCMLPPVTLL